jgi:hypothetical protein
MKVETFISRAGLAQESVFAKTLKHRLDLLEINRRGYASDPLVQRQASIMPDDVCASVSANKILG